MGKQVKTIIACDIKGCDRTSEDYDTHEDVKISTIFHTEQTEGRSVKPYNYEEKLDLCEYCFDKHSLGQRVHGWGAQGHNTFEFRECDESVYILDIRRILANEINSDKDKLKSIEGIIIAVTAKS